MHRAQRKLQDERFARCHFGPQWNISGPLDVGTYVPEVAPALETPTNVALHHHSYPVEIFFDILVDLRPEGGEIFEPSEVLGLQSNMVVPCPVHRPCDIEVVMTHKDGYDITMIIINGLLPVV